LNDVTTYAYYSDTTADHTLGDLQSVRNPAGHLTQYTMYDAEGRVKRWIAANGVVTDVAYTPRGWISSTAVSAGGIPVQTTTYSYEPDGKVATVTLPDATTLTYSYDEARRLNGITDAAGNSVTYVLDNAGNRLSEQYRDPGGVLTREIRRVYDALGRLSESTGAMR
jgi:YD repeat-containing protein